MADPHCNGCQDIQTSTSLTKDYAELIKSRTVTEGVIAQLKLDMTHEELLKKLSVDTPTDTRVVSITVTDTDPYTAAEIANAVRDIASKHIQQVMDIKAVNVVETANIPDEPSSPSVPKNGVIGGLLGILLAAAVVIIVYLTNDTVKTPEDVEKYLGLSVLGTIPYSSFQICLYFLVYSFGGWVVEVIFHAVALGKVINRGFLNGPVC